MKAQGQLEQLTQPAPRAGDELGEVVAGHVLHDLAAAADGCAVGESQPRLPRDVDRWRHDIADMVASNLPWQLVISFNEWPEGTAVEDATEWQSVSGFGAYLDALHTALP